MPSFRITAFAVFLALITVLNSAAEERKSAQLKDILIDISKSSPEIRESVKVFETVNAELQMAKTGYNPVVSAYLSGGREITKGFDTDGKKESLNASTASISLKQNLFNGKGTDNYVKETEARAMAASYDVLNVANKIFLAAAESYIIVLQEKELLAIALDNVTTQARILEQIKERTKSGFGKLSDLTNAQARLALSRANYISQQQNLKQAMVKFHRQAGRFIKTEDFVIPETNYALPKTADDMVDLAFVTYPAINVSDYNIIAKKYGKKRVDAQYYPTVDFELKAMRSTNTGGDEGSTDSQSAMFTMTYNLYDGGRRSAEKQVRSSEMLKEYERSYIERRNLIEAVRLAWNIKEAEDTKIVFLREYVELTEKTRDTFIEENRLGRRSLTEVLNMENEFYSSKSTLTRSKFTSLTAYFRLLQATGLLLSEYDNALSAKVGLPAKNTIDKLEKYGNLDFNRDKDEADDRKDQCQQSKIAGTAPYGCENTEDIEVGYKIPDSFEPYIKPQTQSTPIPADSLEALTARPAQKKQYNVTEDSLGEPVKASGLDELYAEPVKKTKPAQNQRISKYAKKLLNPSLKEQSLLLGSDAFNEGSVDLTDEALAFIVRIAKELRSLKYNYTLKIYAHTDNSSDVETSRDFSKLMVIAVHNKFLELGIPRSVMLGFGKGSSMPIADNSTPEGRIKNKRVELKVIKN